jgi:hypothetical protein
MHTHDGTDGSGRVEHKHLLGIGEDDHHPKNHHHGQDGVDPIRLETDVTGTLPIEHHSPYLRTGLPGNTYLYRNPRAYDKLVRVVTPDSESFLFYDWTAEGRLKRSYEVFGDVVAIEDFYYGGYFTSEGIWEIVLLETTKEIRDIQQDEVEQLRYDCWEDAPVIP